MEWNNSTKCGDQTTATQTKTRSIYLTSAGEEGEEKEMRFEASYIINNLFHTPNKSNIIDGFDLILILDVLSVVSESRNVPSRLCCWRLTAANGFPTGANAVTPWTTKQNDSNLFIVLYFFFFYLNIDLRCKMIVRRESVYVDPIIELRRVARLLLSKWSLLSFCLSLSLLWCWWLQLRCRCRCKILLNRNKLNNFRTRHDECRCDWWYRVYFVFTDVVAAPRACFNSSRCRAKWG